MSYYVHKLHTLACLPFPNTLGMMPYSAWILQMALAARNRGVGSLSIYISYDHKRIYITVQYIIKYIIIYIHIVCVRVRLTLKAELRSIEMTSWSKGSISMWNSSIRN